MIVKSLSHPGITVKNFEAAAKWYNEVFGFNAMGPPVEMDAQTVNALKPLYNLEDVAVRFGFLVGPNAAAIEVFEFTETLPADHTWNRPGSTHFALDVDDAPAWCEFLKKRDDVEIVIEPICSDSADWFFIRDPDGNLIELIDIKGAYNLLHP